MLELIILSCCVRNVVQCCAMKIQLVIHTSCTNESRYYCLVFLDNMCLLSQYLPKIHTSYSSESSYYCLVILDNMCSLSQVLSVIHTSCTSESSHYCLVHLDKILIFERRFTVLKISVTEWLTDLQELKQVILDKMCS